MGMAKQFTTACLWEVGLPKCSFVSKARKVIFSGSCTLSAACWVMSVLI
jgi:hypothetical protein